MGEIVAAVATCHAPQLLTYPPDEDRLQLDASIAAMKDLGTIVRDAEPDAIIFLGSDHLETFSTACSPTFALVGGDNAKSAFAGRTYDVPIHADLTEGLLHGLVADDFDIAYSENVELGHAFAVPFEFVLGDLDIPIVPFLANVYLPPLPSPTRCAALGASMAKVIAKRPERVAIVASGGMSHYPGTWKYHFPEFDFDKWMVGQLAEGNVSALTDLTVEQLDEVGNTELLNWAILLGAIGNVSGELLQYTPTWHHGHAMMRFLPEHQGTVSNVLPSIPYGGFEFRNEGFEFYKRPQVKAQKLNHLLYSIRHDSNLRRNLLLDSDKVVAQHDFTDLEVEAVRTIASVGQAKVISDHTATLVAAGAHPLQALMSLHVMFGEQKKMQREEAQ